MGLCMGMQMAEEKQDGRDEDLAREDQWLNASPEERQRLHDHIFKSIANPPSPEELPVARFTAEEWYGATVHDPSGGKSRVDEIARRRFATLESPSIGDPVPSTKANGGRGPGRPGARATSIDLFKARRNEGISVPSKKLTEAEQILTRWPKGGPERPHAKTVAGHIKEVYKTSASIKR
jgi:hypothetical protein